MRPVLHVWLTVVWSFSPASPAPFFCSLRLFFGGILGESCRLRNCLARAYRLCLDCLLLVVCIASVSTLASARLAGCFGSGKGLLLFFPHFAALACAWRCCCFHAGILHVFGMLRRQWRQVLVCGVVVVAACVHGWNYMADAFALDVPTCCFLAAVFSCKLRCNGAASGAASEQFFLLLLLLFFALVVVVCCRCWPFSWRYCLLRMCCFAVFATQACKAQQYTCDNAILPARCPRPPVCLAALRPQLACALGARYGGMQAYCLSSLGKARRVSRICLPSAASRCAQTGSPLNGAAALARYFLLGYC